MCGGVNTLWHREKLDGLMDGDQARFIPSLCFETGFVFVVGVFAHESTLNSQLQYSFPRLGAADTRTRLAIVGRIKNYLTMFFVDHRSPTDG